MIEGFCLSQFTVIVSYSHSIHFITLTWSGPGEVISSSCLDYEYDFGLVLPGSVM